ncbi:MAG: selenocysteine-specific translation elongation factor [bacterium]|nr:selenocysteine-specific translation elongation factor [bacterium]
MLVIGTAGHIDHGKSSIVKRLTGTDPDRLPEEQARGMTIDLGFAFYQTPDNQSIAFVDVPGHERFVKNMIAGAGGIDAVMLVIAADDGWMPQSEEHFQIVKLLGVKYGMVALNKCDLVEEDWLELLEKEIRSRLSGSFLSSAPIFRLSATTGAGFELLKTHLNTLPGIVSSRKDIGKARLFVDRTFVRQGIGGVVTGTLRGGALSVGQTVSVWPGSGQAKIRSLQSHNEDVGVVNPGSRTAVSLTGTDRSELVRGGVISDRLDLTFFKDHPVLALSVQTLPTAPVPIEDRRRVLMIVGTTEVEGEIRLFDQEAILPGEEGIAFFRPDEPVYGLVFDRLILRLPTPMVTLGGGMILDHLAVFPRRKELTRLHYLQTRRAGTANSLVLSELAKRILAPAETFLREADISEAEASQELVVLAAEGKVARFQNWWYQVDLLKREVASLKESIAQFLKDQPHLKGITIGQLVDRLDHDQSTVELLTTYLTATGEMTRVSDFYDIVGRGVTLKGMYKEAHDKIIAALTGEPYAPPTLQSFASQGKHYQEAIRYIIESREAHKCGAEFLIIHEVWREVVQFVRERLNSVGSFAVTDLRDRFGFSRKYAIPILEEADRLKLTERQGDLRIKGAQFDNEDAFL